jgi:hypothetical protein
VSLKPDRPSADPSTVTRRLPSPTADRGDIVLGWLTKLVVVMSLVGLVGFDAISIGVGRLKAEERAGEAARAAVRSWSQTQDVQAAYQAAVATSSADGLTEDTIDPATFYVGPDGSVTLTVRHTASTLVVEKVDAVADWAVSTATTTASPAK